MTHSFNFHDCAAKRLESDALAAQVAEHLANGGTVKTVPGYAPKPRPVSYMSKNVQQSIAEHQTNRGKVLKAVADGHNTIADVRIAAELSHSATHLHLNQLQALGKVRMERHGNKRIWIMEATA